MVSVLCRARFFRGGRYFLGFVIDHTFLTFEVWLLSGGMSSLSKAYGNIIVLNMSAFLFCHPLSFYICLDL